MPNTHRRRDETIESRRVGGVYWAEEVNGWKMRKSVILLIS